MPKKKRPKKEEWTPVLGEPHDTVLRENFVKDVWRGIPNWICNQCPAAYLDPANAVAHFHRDHLTPPPTSREVDTGLVDSMGESIKRVEEVPQEEVSE